MLDATQLGVLAGPSAHAVEVAAVVDRSVPVGGELLAAIWRWVFPYDFIGPIGSNPQHRPTHAVGLGDKDRVVDYHRHGGIDSSMLGISPGEGEIHLAAKRVEGQQTAASKGEAPAPAAKRGDDRAAVAGQLVAETVTHLAGVFIEGDDPAAVPPHLIGEDVRAARRAAADHGDQE